jgi:hypothetical protein
MISLLMLKKGKINRSAFGAMEVIISMGLLAGGVFIFAMTLKPNQEAKKTARKNYCLQVATVKMNQIRGTGIDGVISYMDTNCSSSCPCTDTESTSDLASYEADSETFMNRLPDASRTTEYEIINIRTMNTDCSKVTAEVGKGSGLIYQVRTQVSYQETEVDDSLTTETCELSETFNPTKKSTTSSTTTTAACGNLDDACTVHGDCCGGFYCDSGPSTCQNCKAASSACTIDEECCGALTCQAGFCAP